MVLDPSGGGIWQLGAVLLKDQGSRRRLLLLPMHALLQSYCNNQYTNIGKRESKSGIVFISMYPVLLTIGPLVISALGFFLSAAFLAAVFIVWRLAKVYDVKEDKILDVAMVTFGGGFIGARLYAVIFNWEVFGSLEKIVLVQRYPGLSFWGGLIGGTLAFWLFTRAVKLQFWQIADFAAVGVLLGLVFGNIGCFLGGCGYGVVSDLPIALPVVGLIGKRLPISLIESAVFLWLFSNLFKQVIKFHFAGKITAVFLIWLGVVKFVTEFYRGDSRQIISPFWISHGHVLSILTLVAGVVVFYTRSKRNVLEDLGGLAKLLSSSKRRELLLSSWKKSWYNHKTAWKMGFGKISMALLSLPRKLKRRLNVKSTPTNIR